MWDHPRVCGEKTFLEPKGQTRLGSPPRMRGKGCNLARGVRPDRITPAYAGKSSLLSIVLLPVQGSPPRMRGKGCNLARGVRPDRITPAYAGKSSLLSIVLLPVQGSPPHVRGKDAVKRHSARGFGITPAYAGKSRGCPAACILRRDHPRVCGEKALLCLSLQQILGSPPRMRGKAFPSIKTILLMRITPAYAGKSC